MSELIRYGGCVLALLAAWGIGSGYSRYAGLRLGEYGSYLKLLSHLEWSLSTRAATVGEWSRSLHDDVLEGLGLLPALRSGVPVKDALSSALSRGHCGEGVKTLLGELFGEYGRCSLESELTKLAKAKELLEATVGREREELLRSVRTFRIILVAAALGTVILLV